MEATTSPRSRFAADLIPGLTTSAVVVPKALAYATIAGLPVEEGLFAAMVPMVVYAPVLDEIDAAQAGDLD